METSGLDPDFLPAVSAASLLNAGLASGPAAWFISRAGGKGG